MIVLGQLYLLLDDAAHIGDHTTEVAPSHIGRHNHLALHVLAVDSVGTYRRHHIGNLPQRHFRVTGIYNQATYILGGSTTVVTHLEGKIKHATTFVDLRHGLAGKQHAHHIGKLRHGDSILGHHIALGHNLQLRALHLLLHVEVGNALYPLNGRLHTVSYAIHLIEVGTEYLHGNAGTSTREHGVDAVTDGRSHLHVHTGQRAQLLAHLSDKFVLGAVGQLEGSLYLRYVHTQGVLIQLGTSGLTAYGLYFGNGEQQLFGTTANLVRLFQRDTRQCGYIDSKRTLIEGRQKRTSQSEESHQRHDEQRCSASQYGPAMTESPREKTGISFLEPTGYGRFLIGVLRDIGVL